MVTVHAVFLTSFSQPSHNRGAALLHGKIGTDQCQRVIGGKASGTGHLLDRLRSLAVLFCLFRSSGSFSYRSCGIFSSCGCILGCGCCILGRCNYILVRFGFVGVSRRDLFLNQCECNGIAHFAIGKGNALNAINGYDVSLLYGIALDDVLHGLTCFCCSRFFHVGGGICDSFVYDFDRMLLLSCADAAVDVGGYWSEGNFDRHPVGSPVDRPCTVWALLALELVDFVADRDPFDDPVHHILEQSGHLGTAGETNASAKLARFVDPHLDRATDLAVHRVRIMTVQKRKPLICAVHSNGGCFADQHFVVVFVPAEARNHFFGRANDIYLAGLLVDGRRLHERPPVQHAHGAVIRFLFCHCYFLFGRP